MPVLSGGEEPIYVGDFFLPESGVVGAGDTLFLRSRAVDLAVDRSVRAHGEGRGWGTGRRPGGRGRGAKRRG